MSVTMPAPTSVADLWQRATDLCGWRLGDLAEELEVPIPPSNLYGKGWAGQLVERALGVRANSDAEADFVEFGIELKTVPLSLTGEPLESTYVTRVPMHDLARETWENSSLRNKLMKILWIPLIGPRGGPLPDRTIGRAQLWTPSAEQELMIQADWRDLLELVRMGQSEDLHGRLGVCLQVRPKGANARARVKGVDGEGFSAQVAPLGFYLRPNFVAEILRAK